MKHTKQITTVFVAAMFLALTAFYACSKDEPSVQTIVPAEETMSEADLDYLNKIIQFKEKVSYIRENPDYKSGEVMSVDSVVWYIEALFNAVYAYPDEGYGETVTDTTCINVDVDDNGFVSFNELTIKYDDLYEIISNFYANSNLSDKGFVLLNLTLAEVVDGKASIAVSAVTGQKTAGSSVYDPFGNDDDWLWGDELGDCNYENAGTDAGEKIEQAIMTNKPLYMPCAGCYFVYSDVDTVNLKGYEYKNEADEYLIFYLMKEDTAFNHDDMCLTPYEMNFHYHGETEIIYDILEPALAKRFMFCDLKGLTDFDKNNYPRLRHNNELFFGIPHLIHPGGIGIERADL